VTTLTREAALVATDLGPDTLTRTPLLADKLAWPGGPLVELAKGLIGSGVTKAELDMDPSVLHLAASLLAGIWSSAEAPSTIVLRPQIFPLASGVQLEWHAGRDHVEISIERTDVIGLYWTNSQDEWDVDLAPGRSPIPRQLVEAVQRITQETIHARGPRT